MQYRLLSFNAFVNTQSALCASVVDIQQSLLIRIQWISLTIMSMWICFQREVLQNTKTKRMKTSSIKKLMKLYLQKAYTFRKRFQYNEVWHELLRQENLLPITCCLFRSFQGNTVSAHTWLDYNKNDNENEKGHFLSYLKVNLSFLKMRSSSQVLNTFQANLVFWKPGQHLTHTNKLK